MILIYSDDQLLNLAFPPPYQELFELFGSQLQSSTENVFAPLSGQPDHLICHNGNAKSPCRIDVSNAAVLLKSVGLSLSC